MKKLLFVYLSLLVLLALTVWTSVSPMNSGLSSSLSLGIAAAKGILVLVYFMNLNLASKRIRFFAFATLIWTAALITLISIDYLTRGTNGILGK